MTYKICQLISRNTCLKNKIKYMKIEIAQNKSNIAILKDKVAIKEKRKFTINVDPCYDYLDRPRPDEPFLL